ncbi:hypothetical protein JAAARDRAFT_88200, partial [Jaapia argillacea MUCL 33604]
HAWIYSQCRKAMVWLGADPNVLKKYCVLDKKDCQVDTGIVDDPKQRKVQNATLPWIW